MSGGTHWCCLKWVIENDETSNWKMVVLDEIVPDNTVDTSPAIQSLEKDILW